MSNLEVITQDCFASLTQCEKWRAKHHITIFIELTHIARILSKTDFPLVTTASDAEEIVIAEIGETLELSARQVKPR